MRSTFKVLFYVNGSKEKNGVVPIMGRVTWTYQHYNNADLRHGNKHKTRTRYINV